jgi:hypothetical protein
VIIIQIRDRAVGIHLGPLVEHHQLLAVDVGGAPAAVDARRLRVVAVE